MAARSGAALSPYVHKHEFTDIWIAKAIRLPLVSMLQTTD